MDSNAVWMCRRAVGLLFLFVLLGASSSGFAQVAQPVPAAPPPSAYPSAPPSAPQAYPPQPQTYPAQAYQAPAQGYPAQAAPVPQAYPQAGYAQPQPYYQQPQPYVATRMPRVRRPRKAMMITGISILAGSYLIATSIAVGLGDEDRGDCRDCRDVAPWLFVPVVGPWIAMSETTADGGLWLLGMVEVAGAALTIGGIVRYLNTKRDYEAGLSWQLPKDRTLSLDMSTSPLLAGPRMKLQF
ncbi:MAG TPA: hypothetical protein VI299_21210 [Polyangiales bacterium]